MPRVWSKSATRQPRDLLRVLRPVVAALGQLDDAAAPDVGIAIGLRDLLAVPRDVVEDEAFAQRQVAERDLVGAEPAEDRVEQDRAGHREVRAPRVEARARCSRFCEIAARSAACARGASAWPESRRLRSVRRRRAVARRRDGAEAEDRARRADDAIEAGLGDLRRGIRRASRRCA